jgi:hypothetical protein
MNKFVSHGLVAGKSRIKELRSGGLLAALFPGRRCKRKAAYTKERSQTISYIRYPLQKEWNLSMTTTLSIHEDRALMV